MQNELNIVSHNLWDFLQAVQQGILDGYVLSDVNQHFPQAFISLYTCTLVKKECLHDYDFCREASDGSSAEFQCRECGDISITNKAEINKFTEGNIQTTPVTLADMVASEMKKSAGRHSKNKVK